MLHIHMKNKANKKCSAYMGIYKGNQIKPLGCLPHCWRLTLLLVMEAVIMSTGMLFQRGIREVSERVPE